MSHLIFISLVYSSISNSIMRIFLNNNLQITNISNSLCKIYKILTNNFVINIIDFDIVLNIEVSRKTYNYSNNKFFRK